jgi:hypothetical protein
MTIFTEIRFDFYIDKQDKSFNFNILRSFNNFSIVVFDIKIGLFYFKRYV